MGDAKLCLVLLLGAVALAHADDDATCLMAKRYKPFHKYEFLYEAESLNFLNGAVNGPKGSCKVEIEVPGPCNYIVRTTECQLQEVTDFDAAGNPVFAPAATSDAFKAAMEKHPLKVTVEGDDNIKLFPEDDEPINILNIKRGMISGFAVPLMEEDKNKNMPTIFGLCPTHYVENAREDIATDVTISRDLSKCDRFRPVSDYRSPLALITGMSYPLANLIKSTQTCNYKFDNAGQHPVFGECLENHILVPFSHKGKNGVTNVSKQKATLLAVSEYNDRAFDHNLANEQTLYPHASVDKSPIQDKDAVLGLLRELAGLSKTDDGHKRAYLAHLIVHKIRKLSAETLHSGVAEALEISRSLTYQALFQCGTPECDSTIMKILRTFDSSSMEIDAAVYAMGMLPKPSRQLVSDMLEMAKFKPSKPIYYGASNAVKKLYKAEGRVTPEIQAVADYALEQIGDCTGDMDHKFLSLKVIGNMAAAMGAASPALKAAVIGCVNNPAATPEVQLAAIQAFRLTTVHEEGRPVLMQVLLDGAAPLQKRVAAYLILIKDPQPSELSQLAAALPIEADQQAKSFVISHVSSILASTAPETQELRQKILDALQGNEIEKVMDPTKFSRFYKLGAMEGNVIFEGASYLPKEVMLDMTLRAFGYEFDVVEFGMEGTGLEPTVEALFGPNGFFPDTVLSTLYFAADKMPGQYGDTLKNILPAMRNDRKKRQSSQKLLRDIGRNVNKLIRDLKAQDAPEAMVYLRLLGMELGYLKTKDMEEMAYSAAMMIDNLLKMVPTEFIKDLLTSTDNELFAHYIFMDNEFYLPTGPGVPLRVALSGTITPGVKGGIHLSSDMSEVEFMPSAAVEFVTEVGAHFPDFVESGLEMHTNIYHESGLKAKVSVSHNNIKLTVPAPQSPATIVSLTNELKSVHGAEIKPVPSKGDRVDVSECTPVFAGMKYCTALQYSDAMGHDDAPYFPFTGNSKLAIELHPTGEVSEYVANIDHVYEDHTDKVTLTLKSEGAAASEAKAIVQFNRQKYTVAADLEIPDYDLEVGLRFGSVNPETKGKASHSVQIDFVNKNIPQASLVALAKIEGMKDATLDLQFLVPMVQLDAKASAHLHHHDDLTLELETDIKLPETTSAQKITLKYDADKLEAKIKSDLKSEYQKILPQLYHLRAGANAALDLKIGQTDMSVRDVLSKSALTANAYLEKLEVPYFKDMRLPSLPEITLPETVYMNAEADATYHFGKHYYTISIPLPHGGKSTYDLNFPAALTTPHLTVPQLGLEVASVDIPVPEIFVPEHVSVSLPVLGRAEVTAKVHSNIYNLEAEVSAGRDPVDHPSYSAKVEATGNCPVDLFCFKVGANGLLAGTPGDALKAEFNTHFNHKFLEATASVEEVATLTDKFSLKSNNKIEANSPLGLHVSVAYDGVANLNMEEISGNGNLNTAVRAGPVYGGIAISQTVEVFPFKPEAKIDSTVKIDSTLVKAQNTFALAYANNEMTATSNTAAFDDTLVHHAEVTLKDSTLAVKSDAKAEAFGLTINNVAEASAGAGAVNIKMETKADHPENHIHSTVSATLDVNGLAVNSEADVKLFQNTATHKASLTMNKDGVATNGVTSLQSPLVLENTFNAQLDASKITFTFDTKGNLLEVKASHALALTATPSSIDFKTNAEALVTEGTSYKYSIVLDAHDYTASLNINNDLNILHANLMGEAMLKAEPYKADLTGEVKASYGEEELKHTFEVKYADVTANAKCSTTGKLIGSHLSQNTEVEVAGLTVRVNNDARFNSPVLRFDNTIRATAVPFAVTLDAIANADGDLTLYGKHTAQVYAKYLMKAEPLAFADSFECRVSTNQNLENGISAESVLDNKMVTMLTPSEQKAHVTLKSKFNNHAMNQEISIYNNPERLGAEVSGTFLTSLLNVNGENHEFSASGFLKYDKSTSSHIIHLPFIESFPIFLEHAKLTIVSMAEALQAFIVREDIINKLESIPQHISDFVKALNVEERAIQLKQNILSLTREYAITIEDLEAAIVNLKEAMEKLLSDLAERIHDTVSLTREMIASGTLPQEVVNRLTAELNALTEEYDINAIFVSIIETFEEILKQIDLMRLKDSSIAFLHDLEAKYAIKATLMEKMSNLKNMVSNFSLSNFVQALRDRITSVDIRGFTKQVVEQIPTEQIEKTIENIKSLVVEMDVVGKINAGYAQVRALLVKYELDKRIEEVLEKIVELIQKFKIDETVQVIANTLKTIHIPVTETLEHAVNYLKATDIKEVINHLNEYIEAFVNKVKSFDYNAFVDHANEKIAEITTELNALIAALEIPQKVEAIREFFNFALTKMTTLLEELRSIKVAEALKTLKDILVVDIEGIIQVLKAKLEALDIKGTIEHFLQIVSNVYTKVMDMVVEYFNGFADAVNQYVSDQAIVGQLKQMIEGVATALKTAELEIPTFTVPFTTLEVPSYKMSLASLQDSLPAQIDVPEFTILGFHTVPAMTITYDDVKQKVLQLIDFIVNFDITIVDVDAFFGDLTMNYLPDISSITLPAITLPEVSLPAIPKFSADHFIDIPLQIPEIKLPHISPEIMVPAFGKLYGEFKVNSPLYAIRNAGEFGSASESETTLQFIGSFTSQGTSPVFESLNYNLDASAQLKFPELSHAVFVDTLKLTSAILNVDHEATVTFDETPFKASAKTTVKATTAPLAAELVSNVNINNLQVDADATYSHHIQVPLISFTNEVALTQKAVGKLEGLTFTLTMEQQGNAKFALPDYSDEGTIKGDLTFTMDPSTAKLTYTGDLNSNTLKMKQVLNIDEVYFSHLVLNARVETESPFIKSSVVTGSFLVHLGDNLMELKVNHDTELTGFLSGTLSNSFFSKVKDFEMEAEFQNKANAKAGFSDTIQAKLDVQSDHSVEMTWLHQRINSMTMAKMNQYKTGYNVTYQMTGEEIGLYAHLDSEANFDFLTVPISIPELAVPFTNFKTPAITDFNIYEKSGLNHILTSTDQTIDFDAKIVYKRSQLAPLLDLALIQITPAVGSLHSEASFKSSIFNLNINAEISAEDDLMVRFGAISTSEFESLKAKLDGTSSLTTKRGVKLATAVSLENVHFEATHDCNLNVNTEEIDATLSSSTVAKINLPIFNAELNHQMKADHEERPKATSALKIKYNLDVPVVKVVGSGDAENNMKFESTLGFISAESVTKGKIDGTILDTGIVKGALDNTANIYFDRSGIRSTLKAVGNAHVSYGDLKIEFDLDEDIALEGSVSRVYSTAKINSNNEINIAALNTKGKYDIKSTMDLTPLSTLADIEIDFAQPNPLGDLSFTDKTVVELTSQKQKIACNAKMVNPLATTTAVAELEGGFPNYKIIFKMTATSPIEFLVYDLDSSITSAVEDSALSVTGKAVLTHAEATVDVQNVLTAAMSDDGAFRHSVNVDVSSPTFTDVNFRYAARKDGVTVSVSTPSTGFLGLQLQGRVPSQLYARLYSRFASALDNDVEILSIKAVAKDGDKLRLQVTYNPEAPKEIMDGLEERIPAITSTFVSFADKYGFVSAFETLKHMIVNTITDAYNTAKSHSPEMSQLSVFFRDVVVQYQKTVQTLVDAIVKFLRETHIELQGMEKATLPEILQKITINVGKVVEQLLSAITENLHAFLTPIVEAFNAIHITLPSGEVITGSHILDQVKAILLKISEMVKNLESFDNILAKVNETFHAIVERALTFIDSIHSDILNTVTMYFNTVYHHLLAFVKTVTDHLDSLLNMQELNDTVKHVLEFISSLVEAIYTHATALLPHDVDNAFLKVSSGKLELEVPFSIHQ